MKMEGKPFHYDGSFENHGFLNLEATTEEPFVLTDEMRMNISGNPYGMDQN